MKFTDPIRKYILSGMVAFIVIGLIVANVMASKQDERFAANEALYNHAIQLQSSGNIEEAYESISQVLKNKPDSEVANYMAGIIAAQKGNMPQATIYMQKTLDINPHKVEDPMFMIQLGEIFVAAEKYEEAKIVLLRCQEWGWAPEELPDYQAQVSSLLAQIENSQ
ncbi:tetratricopeptide repeat protein [Lysinibacillus sp. NPDC096418]|uniref:tetratricopeptide repeat protein n=1 Tax=Lysinibacillus sp. NPDC096418 TaxID=3364138 RepID=UPI003829803E